MIDRTIQDLELRIRNTASLSAAQKNDLQALVDELRREVVHLAETHGDDAESIVQFTGITAGEGLRQQRNTKLLKIAVSGIRASVEKFETTHPGLTMAANNLATYFSNLGI